MKGAIMASVTVSPDQAERKLWRGQVISANGMIPKEKGRPMDGPFLNVRFARNQAVSALS